MTREEAIECNKNLRMYMKLSDKNQPCKFLEDNYIALDMAIAALERQKTGKWIEHKWADEREGLLVSDFECSCCHDRSDNDYYFCPVCGARMEGI